MNVQPALNRGNNPHLVSQESFTFIDDIVEKVCCFANDLFDLMREAFYMPFCILGSKHFSILGVLARLPQCIYEAINKRSLEGFAKRLFSLDSNYSYFAEREASKKEVKDVLGFAAISSYIQNDNLSWITPFGYKECNIAEFCPDIASVSSDFEIVKGCLISRATGLKIRLLKTTQGYCVTFGALSSLIKTLDSNSIVHHAALCIDTGKQAVLNTVGIRAKIYKTAEKAFQCLLASKKLKGANIQLTGNCFGACLASYLGIKFEKKAVCFNTLALGVALQADLGEEKLNKASDFVTNFIGKTDFIADLPLPFTLFDYVTNTIGIKTAGIFGQKFYVKSPYMFYSYETHVSIMDNLLHHLGLDHNLKPKQFSEKLITHVKECL